MHKKNAVFLYSDQLEKNYYPSQCPFNTERVFKLRKTLASMGLLGGRDKREVEVRAADRAALELFHSPIYLDALQEGERGVWDIDALKMGIGGQDTPVFKGMYDYGALAAGASLQAVDMILAGETDYAFNPAGGLHHAGPELASGFCYINDMAIAGKYLVQKGKKVLYLDVDVHHGDGVQNAFYNTNKVMTISLHETGKMIFPGTGFEDEIGEGEGKGYAVNIPLPPDTFSDAYMKCFNEIVIPLIESYDADIILFELGADALAGDPLAHLKLTNTVYEKIINFLKSLDKPVLMTGGGGYNIENTVRAWAFAWSVLTGEYEDVEAMNFGLGGVMLESTDWTAGLKDRAIPVSDEQRESVEPAIAKTLSRIKEILFPIHGPG